MALVSDPNHETPPFHTRLEASERQADYPSAPGAADVNKRTSALVISELQEEIVSVLRIPSFIIIVAQGVWGNIPWAALVYLTLYLQLQGMSSSAAAGLVAFFLLSVAAGGIFGGVLGDLAETKWPTHGRIIVAQISVFLGIPLAVLLIGVRHWTIIFPNMLYLSDTCTSEVQPIFSGSEIRWRMVDCGIIRIYSRNVRCSESMAGTRLQ